MPTRNVVITEHQAKLIDELVACGRYQNASEVLREGIRLIEEREKEQAAKLEALRAAVQVGIDDVEAGRYKVFENTRELSTHLDRLSAKVFARKKAR